MHFLYVNSTSNALHVFVIITVREVTEQKLNILLEWPCIHCCTSNGYKAFQSDRDPVDHSRDIRVYSQLRVDDDKLNMSLASLRSGYYEECVVRLRNLIFCVGVHFCKILRARLPHAQQLEKDSARSEISKPLGYCCSHLRHYSLFWILRRIKVSCRDAERGDATAATNLPLCCFRQCSGTR